MSETATERIGKWLSAALDDPGVCAEMKADINAWFAEGEPLPASDKPALFIDRFQLSVWYAPTGSVSRWKLGWGDEDSHRMHGDGADLQSLHRILNNVFRYGGGTA